MTEKYGNLRPCLGMDSEHFFSKTFKKAFMARVRLFRVIVLKRHYEQRSYFVHKILKLSRYHFRKKFYFDPIGDKAVFPNLVTHTHIYVYIYVCGQNIFLNCTLEIDSPFNLQPTSPLFTLCQQEKCKSKFFVYLKKKI